MTDKIRYEYFCFDCAGGWGEPLGKMITRVLPDNEEGLRVFGHVIATHNERRHGGVQEEVTVRTYR